MQWPLLLDMTELECKSALRSMELVAYSEVVSVLRARGELTPEKRRLLSDLCSMWNISTDRHRAELRRVANDEKLNTIAETLFGAGTRNEWVMEGRRVVPVLPRARPITVYTAVADSSCRHEQQLCAALVPPSQTKTYRPVLESKPAVFSPVLRAAMSPPVDPEQPADTSSVPATPAPPVTSTPAPSIVTPLPISRAAPLHQADAAVSEPTVRGIKRRHRSASDPGQYCTDPPPSSDQLQTTVGVSGDRVVNTSELTTQKGAASRPPAPAASVSPAAAVSLSAATAATSYQRTVARGPPPSRHPLTAANNVAQTASTQKVIFVAASRGGLGALSTPRSYQCAPTTSDSEQQRKVRPPAQQPLVATPAVDPNTEAYRQLAGSGGLSAKVRMRGGRTAAGKRPVYSPVPVRGHQLRALPSSSAAVPSTSVRLLAQPGRSAVGPVGRSLFVMPHSPALLRSSGHAVGQLAVRQTVTARPRGQQLSATATGRPSVIVLQRAAGGQSGSRPALLRPVRPRPPRPHRLPTPQPTVASSAGSCSSLADVLAVAGIVEQPTSAAVSTDGAAGLSKTATPFIAVSADVVAGRPVVRDEVATVSRPAAARLTAAAAVTSSAGRTNPLETAHTFTLAEAMDLLESPDDLLSRQSMGEQERHFSALPVSGSSGGVAGPAAGSRELVGELDPRTGIFYPGAADDTAVPARSAAGHVEEAGETLDQITAFLEDDVICASSTTPGSGGM